MLPGCNATRSTLFDIWRRSLQREGTRSRNGKVPVGRFATGSRFRQMTEPAGAVPPAWPVWSPNGSGWPSGSFPSPPQSSNAKCGTSSRMTLGPFSPTNRISITARHEETRLWPRPWLVWRMRFEAGPSSSVPNSEVQCLKKSYVLWQRQHGLTVSPNFAS